MKKRVIALATAFVLSLGVAGTALAADTNNVTPPVTSLNQQAETYKSYIKTINKIKQNYRRLENQIRSKNRQIRNLLKKARKDKATEKIARVKELNQKIKTIKEQIKEISNTRKTDITALRQARKNKDKTAFAAAAAKVIGDQKQINQKLREWIQTQNEIIKALR